MADIIIHKQDDVSDFDALLHVQAVISDGRISGNGTCYCYVTKFSDGFYVYADKKKADIFTARRVHDGK
jgi:hypothetical protein